MPGNILQIENVKASSGEKQFGFVKLGGILTSSFGLPIGLVTGRTEGPTLCLIAGVHGCEYAGIEAAIRAYTQTDPSNLSGRLIIIPVVNMPSFLGKVPYVCPLDGVNISRAFPGNPQGSISYRIAHFLLEKIASKSNYLIDLHGGDLEEMTMPGGFVIFGRIGDSAVDKATEELAKMYGTEYVWMISKWPEGSSDLEFSRRGVPSIVAECGGLGAYEESHIKAHADGITNVMKYLKMIPGAPRVPNSQKTVQKAFEIRATNGGILYPQSKAGDTIKQGDTLGEIRNLQGETIENIVSPVNGVIRIWFPSRIKNPGDCIYRGWVL